MRLKLLLLAGIFWFQASAQKDVVYFADAVKAHLNKYNLRSDLEFERGNIERANFMFDSLVRNHLVGSRFENYVLKNARGGKVRLAKIKKPVFIITYASWCVVGKGEAQALNKLARKHSKDVQFVVLFWDKKRNVKSLARRFSSQIKVCYAHETYRNDSRTVSVLKHTFGFPTSYYLNEKMDLVDIKRGGNSFEPKVKYMTAFNENYKLFSERLSSFLIKKDLVAEQIADKDY